MAYSRAKSRMVRIPPIDCNTVTSHKGLGRYITVFSFLRRCKNPLWHFEAAFNAINKKIVDTLFVSTIFLLLQ